MSAFPVSLHCFPEQVSSCHLLSQMKPSLSILPRVETLGSGVSRLSMGDAAGIRWFWSFLGPSSLSLWPPVQVQWRGPPGDRRLQDHGALLRLLVTMAAPQLTVLSPPQRLEAELENYLPTCARGAEQQGNRTAQAGT